MRRFRDKKTEALYWGHIEKGIPADVAGRAHNKIKFVAHAQNLSDIGRMPGSRLEKLSGSRKEQYSIRVNDQWRICFYWNGKQAAEIELVDYH
jgi:proteic killer suppression protein